MNIAYIIPSKVKFGPNLVVYDLTKLMIERGHHVIVYYFDEVTDDALIDFPCKTIKINFFSKIDFKQYDVVHSHCLRPDAYVFIHKPYKSKTRFITTIHNFVREDLKSTYNNFISVIFTPIWMLLLKRHDVRVTLSKTAKLYYEHWFKAEKLEYVYNTRSLPKEKKLEPSLVNELLNFKGKSFLLGANAGETYRKGVDQIIRALPFLPNVKLFVFWRTPDRPDLRTLAKDLNVEKQIFFAGFREDAYLYQKYFDAFVIPSRSEGFPLAMLEAVVLKKNIICSDIPIFKEFFNSEQVTFFHLEDIASLVDAIKIAQKIDKSVESYKKYLLTFAPNIIAERYLKIYKGM